MTLDERTLLGIMAAILDSQGSMTCADAVERARKLLEMIEITSGVKTPEDFPPEPPPPTQPAGEPFRKGG